MKESTQSDLIYDAPRLPSAMRPATIYMKQVNLLIGIHFFCYYDKALAEMGEHTVAIFKIKPKP